MKVLINLSENPSLKRSRNLGLAIKPFLEGLVTANLLYLATHHVPLLYKSGVRYQEEPPGTVEEFAGIPVIIARGWGDCDDLAPWRCAELRRSGEKAKIRLTWRQPVPGGRKEFHVQVRREDGRIEDPSLILGMNQ